MKRLVLLIVCLAALALTGCQFVWVHEDWHEGKYEEDLGECAKQQTLKACKQSKGWTTQNGWKASARSRQK